MRVLPPVRAAGGVAAGGGVRVIVDGIAVMIPGFFGTSAAQMPAK